MSTVATRSLILRSNAFRSGNRYSISGSINLEYFSKSILEDEKREKGHVQVPRMYHTSPQIMYNSTKLNERNFVALAMGMGAVAVGAHAGASAIKAYKEWKSSQPVVDTTEDSSKTAAAEEESASAKKEEAKKDGKKKEEKRENIFAKWFDVGSKYYEGGFEDIMTKKEAALVLGVRQTSTVKRIEEAHKKMLIINHPDKGGSTYISGKINEAKELLTKGKSRL